MVKGHWSETDNKRQTKRQAGKDRIADRETKWAANSRGVEGWGKRRGGGRGGVRGGRRREEREI